MSTIVLFNKPYGVLSQFTPEGKWRALAEFIQVKDIYVAGRLDADSEGLLILTDDGKLQAKIADPQHKLEKTYWAQVEGVPDEVALDRLRAGIGLSDFTARPARVRAHQKGSRLPAPAAIEAARSASSTACRYSFPSRSRRASSASAWAERFGSSTDSASSRLLR